MPELVSMEIRIEQPPLFDRIVEVFPNAVKHGVLFCWGGTIYNPSNITIPAYLIAHENVHRKQQGKEPGFWWEKYLLDKDFRLAQEIPAHQEEYREYGLQFSHRNMRRQALRVIAERLSGPLYGNMLSFEKAKAIVKEAP